MLTIVASTYLGHSAAQLRSFVGSLQCQTRKDFKVIINIDGSYGSESIARDVFIFNLEEAVDSDPRFIIKHRDLKGGCGNFWRSHSLYNDVDTKMVHWTNCDNQYTPVFVEYMLAEQERTKADIVICQAIHNYAGGPSRTEAYRVLDAEPRMNWIDYVNFICDTELAKKTGFNHGEHTGSDGLLVQEMVNWNNPRVSKIHRVLSIHN